MKVPKKIESSSLLLRYQDKTDEKPFIEFMCNSEATKYLSFTEEQKTEAGAKELLYYTIEAYKSDEPLFILSAIDRTSSELVGVCGLNPLANQSEIEIFYIVLVTQWGNGYASEMAAALLAYVENETSYESVVAYIVPENIKAQVVAMKAGFINEGLVENENFENMVYKFERKLKQIS